VETSDRGDPPHLFAIEPRKGGVKDQVLGVAMVLRPTHGGTDVVKQRGAFQQFPIERSQAVISPRSLEHRHRKARDVSPVASVQV
jgi:hypothetical protein